MVGEVTSVLEDSVSPVVEVVSKTEGTIHQAAATSPPGSPAFLLTSQASKTNLLPELEACAPLVSAMEASSACGVSHSLGRHLDR